jgi:hypothetical protein
MGVAVEFSDSRFDDLGWIYEIKSQDKTGPNTHIAAGKENKQTELHIW